MSIDRLAGTALDHYLDVMDFDPIEFEISGHRQIIDHYRRLLANDAGLPASLRETIVVRIAEAERQIKLLEQKSKRGW